MRAPRLPHWLARRLPPMPSRDELLGMRWLRPFAKHLSEPAIWHWNRRSVARGMALGMFITIAVPLPIQIALSALLAVFVRANVPVAAVCAFVSNPFTTPAILLAAFEIGSLVIAADGAVDLPAPPISAPWFDRVLFWLERAVQWIAEVSLPAAIGLLVMAIGLAAIGYFAVHLLWRCRIGRKWTRRAQRRAVPLGAGAQAR